MLIPRYVLALLVTAAPILPSSPRNEQQLVASAVDAAGKRYVGSRDLPGLNEPWTRDRIKFVAPDYPYGDRAKHPQGDGFFRISIDLKTGLVTQVSILKSTGYASLDASALAAIREWRWKPGRWQQVDMPTRFTMGRR